MKGPVDVPVTRLLAAASDGDEGARQQLWTVIYGELRRLAQRQLGAAHAGQTLQPTVLVHEAFFRLFGEHPTDWTSRRHFFGAAARAMRQIRVDDVRRRNRLKRGGNHRRAETVDDLAVSDQDPVELLAVSDALGRLEQEDARQAEVVLLRYFAGLTEGEVATVLGVSRRTVQVDWRLARAWLHRELSKGDTRFVSADP